MFKKFNHKVSDDIDEKAEEKNKSEKDKEKFIAFKFSHHVEKEKQEEINAEPKNISESDLEEIQDVQAEQETQKNKKKEVEVVGDENESLPKFQDKKTAEEESKPSNEGMVD